MVFEKRGLESHAGTLKACATKMLRSAFFALVALSVVQGRGQKKEGENQEAMRANPAAAAVDSSSFASCPAGGPLGEMSLTVSSGDRAPLPLSGIIHLTEGDVVDYKPIDRGHKRREGEISLVLVPAKISGKEELMVTDPKDAGKAQQWRIPRSMALAVFVYGPQGLSSHRVKSFLSQDDSLVAQLAEYADKTLQTEALIAALSSGESSSASVNAALSGFASQYGVQVQLDRSAPPAAQAQALFTAINPQLSSYSPLASSSSARTTQTASLATAAAGLFFGSPVGVLAGSTSMLLDLKSIAFPDTQFRSSFALSLKNGHTSLCGERLQTPARTRLAYLWALRIPNAAKPALQIGDANYLPEHQKSPVPVSLTDNEWKYLQRARDWFLESATGERYPISLTKLQNQKSVEVDLSKVKMQGGTYQLGAWWDWVEFKGTGDIHVLPLPDLSAAKLTPTSQDKLLASGGRIPVTVIGADFEFTSKVEIKRARDQFALPVAARFLLSKGLRLGPQTQLDVLVDTKELEPGDYQLLLSQVDEKAAAVPFKILPNPPKFSNLPVLVNSGGEKQHFLLKGERLDAVARMEAAGATFTLDSPGPKNSERALTVTLETAGTPGAKLPVKIFVKDRSEPLTYPDALEIGGPLPAIASSKLAIPAAVGISLRPDEFPAGYALSATLDVKNVSARSILELSCNGDVAEPVALHLGQQTPTSSLQQLSADQLYLLFDTAALPAGCDLRASVDNGRDGVSAPYALAHILRLPQIDTFESATAPVGDATAASESKAAEYTLKGHNLEMIEKLGWDPASGSEVTSLPIPIPGEGQRQSLTVSLPFAPANVPPLPLPEAAPKQELFIWLRGDKEPRTAAIRVGAQQDVGLKPAAAR